MPHNHNAPKKKEPNKKPIKYGEKTESQEGYIKRLYHYSHFLGEEKGMELAEIETFTMGKNRTAEQQKRMEELHGEIRKKAELKVKKSSKINHSRNAFFDRVGAYSHFLNREEALEMARFEIMMNPEKLKGEDKIRYEKLKSKVEEEFKKMKRK